MLSPIMMRFLPILVILMICVVILSLSQPTRIEINARTLSTPKVLEYVKHSVYNDKLSIIDMIILPPSIGIMDNKPISDNNSKPGENGTKPPTNINYTILSLLKFCPWIRRFHFYNTSDKKQTSKTSTEYWLNESRFVEFIIPPQDYIATTPLLSENFLILSPKTLVTMSLFPWQFFIENKKGGGAIPIYRTGSNLILPLTRTLLNPIAKATSNNASKDQNEQLVTKASKSRDEKDGNSFDMSTIFRDLIDYMRVHQIPIYVNNQDGFDPTSLRYNYDEEKQVLEALLVNDGHAQPHSNEKRDLVIMYDLNEETMSNLEKKDSSHPKIWINLYSNKSYSNMFLKNNKKNVMLNRLKLMYKALLKGHLIFEVNADLNVEKIGSLVMEFIYREGRKANDNSKVNDNAEIKNNSKANNHNDGSHKIETILTPKKDTLNNRYKKKCLEIANKLAVAFTSQVVEF